MARPRTGVAHDGRLVVDSKAQHWVGDLLGYVLRMHILREIGLPPETLEARVVDCRRFLRAIGELAAKS